MQKMETSFEVEKLTLIDCSIWLFVIEHVHSDCKLVFELIFTVDFDC